MSVIQPSIGVFDSGIGGLTVLKELRALLPGERFIYLGDTARTPYGSKGRETIIRYTGECRDFLLKENIKILVVACNTASSFALQDLENQMPIPVVGTIDPAIRIALEHSPSQRIGVIGTEATIASAVYEKKLIQSNPSADVFSKACPLFVPLVEQGMFEGEIVEKVVELYLSELRVRNPDVLILGCTHYPLLKPVISRFMGSSVRIVECSKAIAIDVEKLISAEKIASPGREATSLYFVTDGVARFNKLAELIFDGVEVKAVKVQL